jgi:hypothetical protein
MENKKQLVITAVIVIAIVATGLVAIPGLSQKVFADRDLKSKRYVSEDGSGDRTIACTKETGGCKNLKEGTGDNINQLAKEFYESDSGQKCKRSK